jgi:hypothetical protein
MHVSLRKYHLQCLYVHISAPIVPYAAPVTTYFAAKVPPASVAYASTATKVSTTMAADGAFGICDAFSNDCIHFVLPASTVHQPSSSTFLKVCYL